MPESDVKIFDTTLRDGEQSPGYAMTINQKLRMAKALEKLRVDIIEAGFAAASPADFEAVQQIAKESDGQTTICSLARCHEGDIKAAGEAIAPTKNGRIHVFIATSPIHREFKLKMDKDEIIKKAQAGIQQAATYTSDIEFSAEDAIRTERDYLVEVLEAAIEAGATTLNIPDTVGYTTPLEAYDLFEFLKKTVKGADKVIFSTHFHNDLGMAVANSLSAVRAGARQIECSINGIGERAGNCSLEEAVMALKTRKDVFDLDTNVNTQMLYPTSKLLCTITGNGVARNKAIVGQNAFAHESGIHQHGMLQNKETYEIMKPEDIGLSQSSLVLGKHSGRHALSDKAQSMGFSLTDDQLDRVFKDFKVLADKKKEVFESDIEAIILGDEASFEGPWKLEGLHVTSGYGAGSVPYASVEISDSESKIATRETATGDGPIDAVFSAMESITGIKVDLKDFSLKAISEGEDAQAEASVHVVYEGQNFNGRGVNTDVVAAGSAAFLDALNRVHRFKQRFPEKQGQRMTQTDSQTQQKNAGKAA